MVKVGDSVIYCDAKGVDHNALVTIAWSPDCLNLIYVSDDENQKDQYGRQTKHETSVTRGGPHTAHGRYWRLPSDERVPYQAPQAV